MKTFGVQDFFIVFDISLFVTGYARAAIYDLQRSILQYIDKEIYFFCKRHNKKKILDIISEYHNKEDVIQLIEFLVKNEYAFIGSESDATHIKPIKHIWKEPCLISNSVVEFSSYINDNLFVIKGLVDKYLIQAIEFVSYTDIIELMDIECVLQTFANCTALHEISFCVKYDSELCKENLIPVLRQRPLSNQFVIHSAPFTEYIQDVKLLYVQQKIESFTECGRVDLAYLYLNKRFFMEAREYNSCLNRKLCIDSKGFIKNCLAMSETLGHISDDMLNFPWDKLEKFWHIKKDLIEVCKDCEYRYACQDCRCFVKSPENVFSQPSKCLYNPYIAKWEGECGYVPIEECGIFDNQGRFVPDVRKIRSSQEHF
ncbi:MAG: grasp-with-spasm system SPASM domain peptide maturase [Bacteroidales bacterium]|nr:grasp-with-spasm system SPASM domain peptide maturase [Bacteroidales bacterium]